MFPALASQKGRFPLSACFLFFRINLEILKAHFANCVKHSFESGSEADKDAKISELVGVLDKLLK